MHICYEYFIENKGQRIDNFFHILSEHFQKESDIVGKKKETKQKKSFLYSLNESTKQYKDLSLPQ